jgi:hypothetical protein
VWAVIAHFVAKQQHLTWVSSADRAASAVSGAAPDIPHNRCEDVMRYRYVSLSLAVLLTLSCGDAGRPTAPGPDATPSFLISDAVHGGGNTHFFWLAPRRRQSRALPPRDRAHRTASAPAHRRPTAHWVWSPR